VLDNFFDVGSVILYRADDPTHSGVSPNDGRLRVAPEQTFHLIQVSRWRAFLREWDIEIAVQDGNQAGFSSEVEDSIKRRIFQTGYLPGHLCGNKFLMYRELANAREDAGKGLEHTTDVVGGVHVRRIEACNHRVETSLLLGRKRLVGHRNRGIGERIV